MLGSQRVPQQEQRESLARLEAEAAKAVRQVMAQRAAAAATQVCECATHVYIS